MQWKDSWLFWVSFSIHHKMTRLGMRLKNPIFFKFENSVTATNIGHISVGVRLFKAWWPWTLVGGASRKAFLGPQQTLYSPLDGLTDRHITLFVRVGVNLLKAWWCQWRSEGHCIGLQLDNDNRRIPPSYISLLYYCCLALKRQVSATWLLLPAWLQQPWS